MSLVVDGVGVTYSTVSGEPLVALDDIHLEIHDGEFVTIIGPSGCGKSTLLQCLGGLLTPTAGRVTIDGMPIKEPDPRLTAYVFQDYTLLPWKTAAENTSIGLRFAGESKTTRREKAAEMLSLVGLSDFAKAYPRELSGGMQQRVAVARAMSMEPKILLLDEPFGALDEQTRRHLGSEMAHMLSDNESTVVMVTHSLDEAILWGDRIITLSARPGQIAREIKVDMPRPRSLDFMGTPEFNQIRAELFTLLESFGNNRDEELDS